MISCITKNSNPANHGGVNWIADYVSDLVEDSKFTTGDLCYVIENDITYKNTDSPSNPWEATYYNDNTELNRYQDIGDNKY